MSMIIFCRENPRGKRCRSTCEETNESKTETDETTGKIFFFACAKYTQKYGRQRGNNENISYLILYIHVSMKILPI